MLRRFALGGVGASLVGGKLVSDLSIGKVHPVLQKIAKVVSSSISGSLHQSFHFEPSGISIACHHTQTKLTPVAFSIERRNEVPFWDNTYYSAAPLSTSIHMELIGILEEALVQS
jgi:hypothetical protein